jgi:hypothetical protein
MASREEIESLIPNMVQAGVGLGNVPYKELMTFNAGINEIGPDGCQRPKANIQKTTTYIRSADYNLYDPPSMFFDRQAVLDEQLSRFVEKYAMRKAEFSVNGVNERITVPVVSLPRKILVAGDSVAVGAMIDDSETIASQMQRLDPTAQYINIGVNGVEAAAIVCRLKSAADRYKGQLAGLIYIYCENDFDPEKPFGKPEEVLAWLKEYAAHENISKVTIVFAPYIYNIIPNLTRFPGSRGAEHGLFLAEADALKKGAAEAGFNFLSIADVAMEEGTARHSDFGIFALFVDQVHLSEYGVSKLVEKLQAF